MCCRSYFMGTEGNEQQNAFTFSGRTKAGLPKAQQSCPQPRAASPSSADGLAEPHEAFGTQKQPGCNHRTGSCSAAMGSKETADLHIWPHTSAPPKHTSGLALTIGVWLVCLANPPLLSDKVNRVEREHLFMRRLSSERQ